MKHLDTETCSECGEEHNICPRCGDNKVTQIDSEFALTPGDSLVKRVLSSDDGDTIEFKTVCWNCGWTLQWTVEVNIEEEGV